MFSLTLFIYVILISFIVAQNKHQTRQSSKFNDDVDLIIEPLELVLNSTTPQGVFHCNSRVDISKQPNRLTASINHPISTTPTFQLETKQTNISTIDILISPNGYIGTNRISCHWDNNVTFGHTVDLIIGEQPGVIQLKERCRAYDRRYVQCIFRAPIIARAFRNGFPRLFQFSELNNKALSYKNPPQLVNITDTNELIFHFQPRDRNIIPKKTSMTVNMTLSRFGSSVYTFNIEPVHTTDVKFRIENISCKKLTIHISYNQTGTISERLCSGHINRVDGQQMLTAFQDIPETSIQNISIDRLHSSTKYRICLRCYYKQTDQSYKEEECLRITTDKCRSWILICVAASVVAVAIVVVIFVSKRLSKAPPPRSPEVEPPTVILSTSTNFPFTRGSDVTPEPSLEDPLLGDHDSTLGLSEETGGRGYTDMNGFIERITDPCNVSPDTRDLTHRHNEP